MTRANLKAVQCVNSLLDSLTRGELSLADAQVRVRQKSEEGLFDRDTILAMNFASRGLSEHPEVALLFSEVLVAAATATPYQDAAAHTVFTMASRSLIVLKMNFADRLLTLGQDQRLLSQARTAFNGLEQLLPHLRLAPEAEATLLKAKKTLLNLTNTAEDTVIDVPEFLTEPDASG